MKIVIISDTHGDTSLINKLMLLHQDVNVFIHCGDSCLPPYMLSRFIYVKGNCDYYDYPLTRDLELEGFKIHIEHGNRLKTDPISYLNSSDTDILITGHTHCLKILELDKKLYINPGSLTNPRDASMGSYVLLILESGTYKYEVKRVNLD